MKRVKFAHGTSPLSIAQIKGRNQLSAQPTQHHIAGTTCNRNGCGLVGVGRGGRSLLADHGRSTTAVRLPGRPPAEPLPAAAGGRVPVVHRRV